MIEVCNCGGGHPIDTTTIDPLDLLAVCGAPSTIVLLDNIVAMLRRSPMMVEHQDHHHAVVLTLPLSVYEGT